MVQGPVWLHSEIPKAGFGGLWLPLALCGRGWGPVVAVVVLLLQVRCLLDEGLGFGGLGLAQGAFAAGVCSVLWAQQEGGARPRLVQPLRCLLCPCWMLSPSAAAAGRGAGCRGQGAEQLQCMLSGGMGGIQAPWTSGASLLPGCGPHSHQ